MSTPDDSIVKTLFEYLAKTCRQGERVVSIPDLREATGLSGGEFRTIVQFLPGLFKIKGSPETGTIRVSEGVGEYVKSRGGGDNFGSRCTFRDVHQFFQQSASRNRRKVWITALAAAKQKVAQGGVELLKNLLSIWENNEQNKDEEFWQQTFADNPIVLPLVFPYPIVVAHGKTYVGGKQFDNKRGNVADYLIKNSLTNSVGLIELKTPMTGLVGRKYRDGIYNINVELVGSVVQVLSYKYSLLTDTPPLEDLTLQIFNPPCLVIAGNT